MKKLITIYISQNKTDILTKIPIIEALLNSAGIEYFSLNENTPLQSTIIRITYCWMCVK